MDYFILLAVTREGWVIITAKPTAARGIILLESLRVYLLDILHITACAGYLGRAIYIFSS